MAANQIPPSEHEETTQQPEPLPWGKNLLGITYLSDDFYEDIPLEFFLGDEESNKFFHLDETADQLGKAPHNLWPDEEVAMASTQVNLYEAKTHFSSLVNRAAKGEVIVIAKSGKPMAKLSPMQVPENSPKTFRKFGQNVLGVTIHSNDWEKDIPLEYFQNEGKENPFGN
jgi:prevent-host-death family protein